MSRLLGIDLGERRIGVAFGDPRTGRARPLVTLTRRDIETDAANLTRLAREHDAVELVVGLPLSLDGSEGPQAARTREWVEALAAHCALHVTWQDERHTSADAEQRIGRPGRGRAGGAPSPAAMRAYRARVDREAATAIVRAFLDARPASRSTAPGAIS